jgi:hypothetical protein
MDQKREIYLKTEDEKILNIKSINWIKKMDDCLKVCTKNGSSSVNHQYNTHKICKSNNIDSYAKLNKYFE